MLCSTLLCSIFLGTRNLGKMLLMSVSRRLQVFLSQFSILNTSIIPSWSCIQAFRWVNKVPVIHDIEIITLEVLKSAMHWQLTTREKRESFKYWDEIRYITACVVDCGLVLKHKPIQIPQPEYFDSRSSFGYKEKERQSQKYFCLGYLCSKGWKE